MILASEESNGQIEIENTVYFGSEPWLVCTSVCERRGGEIAITGDIGDEQNNVRVLTAEFAVGDQDIQISNLGSGYGTSIIEDSNGSIVILASWGDNAFKLFLNGERRINIQGLYSVSQIIQLQDNTYAIGGQAIRWGNQGNNRDIMIARISEDGELSGVSYFGNEYNEFCSSLIEVDDGEILMSGYRDTPQQGRQSLLVRQGNIIVGRGGMQQVLQSREGCFYDCDMNGVISRLDEELSIEWSLNSRMELRTNCCMIEPEYGGVLVAGVSNNRHLRLCRIDPEGNEEWSRTFESDHQVVSPSVIEISPGMYVIVGSLRNIDITGGIL